MFRRNLSTPCFTFLEQKAQIMQREQRHEGRGVFVTKVLERGRVARVARK